MAQDARFRGSRTDSVKTTILVPTAFKALKLRILLEVYVITGSDLCVLRPSCLAQPGSDVMWYYPAKPSRLGQLARRCAVARKSLRKGQGRGEVVCEPVHSGTPTL